MSKLKILDKKSEKSINSEREFLSKLHHPFIVNMHYAFQDNDNLYLVMDMLSGGDLRYHISRHRKFSEEQTRFFIGCIIIALEYIHNNNFIHRDIKPENLVLDEKGYVRVTDFGIAKENCPDNSSETSGTPGYMSPEVMRGLNHSFPVDFFAIGVIGYEFMNGRRPYVGKSRKEIKEQILSKQAMIKPEEIMKGWSSESANFINKLLIRKPEHRLGYVNGAQELKDHPWLKYYPWKELEEKQLPSPFIPEKKDNFDKRYCESVDKIGEETKMRYEELLCDEEYRYVFANFQYNKEEQRINVNSKNSQNAKKLVESQTEKIIHHLRQQTPVSGMKKENIYSNPNVPNVASPVNGVGNYKTLNPQNGSSNKPNNNIVVIPASSRTKRPPSEQKTHHRPLSHSYSTKDVKNYKQESKYYQSKLNSKVKKKVGQQERNLFSLLFNNKKSGLERGAGSSSKGNKNHGRSSSLVSSSSRKNKEYMNKLSANTKGKQSSKKKLNRADSASALFNKSASQYLLNKIKAISATNSKFIAHNKNQSNQFQKKTNYYTNNFIK